MKKGRGGESRRVRRTIRRLFRQPWLGVNTGGSEVGMKGTEQSGQNLGYILMISRENSLMDWIHGVQEKVPEFWPKVVDQSWHFLK